MGRARKRGGWLLAVLAAVLFTPPVAAHSETTVITITDTGFAPRDITVHTGAVVHFANTDAVDHWPASDVHPTHERYPEFDPAQALTPGNSWIFRPQGAGTWTYHDHLFPHRRGTLRVVEEPRRGLTLSAAEEKSKGWKTRVQYFFSRLREWRRRWSRKDAPPSFLTPQALRNLSEKEQYAAVHTFFQTKGIEPTWQFVKDAFTNDAGASLGGRAHDVAHFFGGLVWKERGLAGLSVCDSLFAFGCYHGFTEAAFTGSLDPLPDLARACETIGERASGPWASCIHGIGHGVATYYESKDLDAALQSCDALAAGATYCHDGVFMEFSFTAPSSFYRAQEPLYPCSALAARYQQACARNQPQVMQRGLHMNRRAIASVCVGAPSTIADPCIDALGFALAHESQGRTDIMVNGCREIQGPLAQAKCMSAAAGELVFQNFPQWPSISQAVCGSLAPEFRHACQQRVRETAENYGRFASP